MIRRSHLALIAFAFAATTLLAGDRMLVVISDLHFGVGHDGEAWRAAEDFRWHDDLAAFLDYVDQRGGGRTDLVIAGDLLELWQSITNDDCVHGDQNLSCTLEEAMARASTVIRQHTADLQLLRKFAESGENTLVVVPGNHDAALMFPAIADALLEHLGPRARVATEGYWISPDGLIFVEHGQQIGREVNRFTHWPEPFWGEGNRHLQRTWGEQFVQAFYNRYEEKYSIIDNIAENGGVGYGARAEGLAGLGSATGKFLELYLTDLSWRQFISSLGEQRQPEWDIGAVRTKGAGFLIESLPPDDPLRQSIQASEEDPSDLGITIAEFTDEELTSLCDYRAAMVDEARRLGRTPPVSKCPTRTLGAALQRVISSREKVLARHLAETMTRLREVESDRASIAVFVYGHTHNLAAPFNPNRRINPAWPVLVANTGAWQRIATAEQMKRIAGERAPKEVLTETPLDAIPPCYGFVRVDPYAEKEKPKPIAGFWIKRGTAYQIADVCSE